MIRHRRHYCSLTEEGLRNAEWHHKWKGRFLLAGLLVAAVIAVVKLVA